jgi:hypothetical protein
MVFAGVSSADTGLLNILVQTEAVVAAIIIMVSIVAVQITSSAYTARVIGLFKNSPDFWGVVILYSATIIFTVYTLQTGGSGTYIAICYILGVLCFAVLIPYTYIFTTMLSPSAIYKALSKKITVKTILDPDDPIQPLTDMVHTSMMKYHYETARNTIKAIGAALCDILMQESALKGKEKDKNKDKIKAKNKINKEKEISKRIFDHFSRISTFAATQKNEHLLIITIETIDTIRDIASEKDFKEITTTTIDIINDIGKKAVNNTLEKAATKAITSLSAFTIVLLQGEYIPEAVIVLGYINDIGKISLKKSLKEPLHQEIFQLKDIGDIAKEKDLKFILTVTKNYLESLHYATRKKDAMASQWCASILEKLKE